VKLLFENWRKYLKEGMPQRKAFAQDVRKAYDPERQTWAHLPDEEPPSPYGREGQDAKYKLLMKKGRTLKQLFAKHANRDFLNSLTTVHWTTDIRNIMNIIKGDVTGRDELSALAYLPGEFKTGGDGGRWVGDIGLVIQGHITLLANDMDHIVSGAGEYYTKADPERTKMSGVNKGVRTIYHPDSYEMGKPALVFDKEDWDPTIAWSGDFTNEALVDNWEIVAVISTPETEHNLDLFLKAHQIDANVISPKEAEELL